MDSPATLAGMRASIQRWLRGSRVDPQDINDAINDAIDSLSTTLIRASLSVFMGGPVNLTIDADDQRATVISIADPLTAPTVSDVAATNPLLPLHDVRVSYTYVTDSGTETLASPITAWITAIGMVAEVSPPALVSGAIGWNLYASNSATVGDPVKQNDAPISFQDSWVEDDSGFTQEPDDPLEPLENTTGDNIFYIRHMEVQTPNNTLISWNQGDLDSTMMRRLSQTFATNSQYQTYGFDLINQRQLEIRPQAGGDITARYFYIVKPRRLRFDNSPLPFPTVPAIEFFREFSLALLFLELRETTLAKAWDDKAEKARSRCELAITSMNRPKNQRVTLYRA